MIGMANNKYCPAYIRANVSDHEISHQELINLFGKRLQVA